MAGKGHDLLGVVAILAACHRSSIGSRTLLGRRGLGACGGFAGHVEVGGRGGRGGEGGSSRSSSSECDAG